LFWPQFVLVFVEEPGNTAAVCTIAIGLPPAMPPSPSTHQRMKGKSWHRRCTGVICISSQHGSVKRANATMDKIVSVVHGNRNFDSIRFRAKIAIFDFDSNIVTSLLCYPLNPSAVKKTTRYIIVPVI